MMVQAEDNHSEPCYSKEFCSLSSLSLPFNVEGLYLKALLDLGISVGLLWDKASKIFRRFFCLFEKVHKTPSCLSEVLTKGFPVMSLVSYLDHIFLQHHWFSRSHFLIWCHLPSGEAENEKVQFLYPTIPWFLLSLNCSFLFLTHSQRKVKWHVHYPTCKSP